MKQQNMLLDQSSSSHQMYQQQFTHPKQQQLVNQSGITSNGHSSYIQMQSGQNQNFRVVIRIRPPLNRERVQGC